MEIFTPQLPAQTLPAYNAIGNTGDKLELSLLPPEIDGAATYCRGLDFRITGTITAASILAVNMTLIISSLFLDIPGVATLVNSISGNKLARLFRMRNYGAIPPYAGTNPWTTTAAQTVNGAQAVDLTWRLEFSDVGGRRFDDCAIPVALLNIAKLKVAFNKLTDLQAGITASSLSLTVTPRLIRKREKKLGTLPVLDSTDIAGTEPVIQPFDGKLTHACVHPQADGVFLNGTDYATVGVGFGKLKLCEDASPVDVFYDAFNGYASLAFTKHTNAQTDPTASIPLVFPPGGKQGQHSTFETVPAGYKPRFKVNAAAATGGFAFTYRKLLDQRSPEMQNARRLLGIPEDSEPMTASKKPSNDENVNAYVPRKA